MKAFGLLLFAVIVGCSSDSSAPTTNPFRDEAGNLPSVAPTIVEGATLTSSVADFCTWVESAAAELEGASPERARVANDDFAIRAAELLPSAVANPDSADRKRFTECSIQFSDALAKANK
jgi:hypothetical protein